VNWVGMFKKKGCAQSGVCNGRGGEVLLLRLRYDKGPNFERERGKEGGDDPAEPKKLFLTIRKTCRGKKTPEAALLLRAQKEHSEGTVLRCSRLKAKTHPGLPGKTGGGHLVSRTSKSHEVKTTRKKKDRSNSTIGCQEPEQGDFPLIAH